MKSLTASLLLILVILALTGVWNPLDSLSTLERILS